MVGQNLLTRPDKKSFEGVWVANYRNPGPRRGEPRVGSGPDVAFPLDPLDPLDPVDPVNPLQNSVRLIFIIKNNVFGQCLEELGTHFWF